MTADPPTSSRTRTCLIGGATGSFAIALLHLAIVFLGAPGYRYFGAASLAAQAQGGSLVPALITAALAMVFALWGAYALSGAGVLPPFPLLRTVLTVVTAIYVLRGLLLISDVVRLAHGTLHPVRQLVFSAASLAIGVAHAVGLFARGHRRRDV